jgi:hypothetical protein
MPARGALVACLTGLVTLTSTRNYDLHYYSTYTHVPGCVSIYILRTVVLDYGELLAYWFILQTMVTPTAAMAAITSAMVAVMVAMMAVAARKTTVATAMVGLGHRQQSTKSGNRRNDGGCDKVTEHNN